MSLRLNNRHLAVLGIILLAVIAARLILADTGTTPLNPGHPLSQTWIDTNLNMGVYNLYTLGNVGIGMASPTTGKLVVSGGNVDVSNNKIINLATPTASTDAATKAYVDAAGSGTPITPVDGITSVAPNSYNYVDIRPPAGQTWRVKVAAAGQAGSGGIMALKAYKYDGSSQYGGMTLPGNGGSSATVGLYAEFEITNSRYLRLEYYASAQGGTAYYSYFGDSR